MASPRTSLFDRLILVSTAANQWERALHIFQQMIGARVRPGSNTYTRVIRACMQAGRVQDAVVMSCYAVGLPRGPPAGPGIGARTSLRVLDLACSQLAAMPESFGGLGPLRILSWDASCYLTVISGY